MATLTYQAGRRSAAAGDLQQETAARADRARFIPHADLDRRLGVLARRPTHFTAGALRLCATLDARGLALEISDSSTWRTNTRARVAAENQFSAEIEGLRTMARDEELRLALRIDFARLRLGRTLERHGLAFDDLDSDASLPPEVVRRRREWHALRLEMVERNLYLVLIAVNRYKHTSADRSDLMQAASAALFQAVDGFDWRRGVLFKTYAVHWLNQGFRHHLYCFNRTVRVPSYVQKSLKQVNAALERLGDPHACDADVAREAGLPLRMVASVRSSMRRTRSLDAPLDGREGSRTLASELSFPNDSDPYSAALEDVSIAAGVEAALESLNERERRVVRMRFGIGYGRGHIYSEVAQELGVSLERVRQILGRALSKLRTPRLRKMLEPLVT